MPELPEVETTLRQIKPYFIDNTIINCEVNIANLRYPIATNYRQNIIDNEVISINRRAKYLLFALKSQGYWIHHLGMSGKFICYANSDSYEQLKQKHNHIIWYFSDGRVAVYYDPRRFGFLDYQEQSYQEAGIKQHKHLRHLGLEPLDQALTVSYLQGKFSGKKSAIKQALLDQRIIAGLGNIYVCEALFQAGIHPEREAKSLSDAEVSVLIAEISDVISRAIKAGGSTISDFSYGTNKSGYFQHQFKVYGKAGEICKICNDVTAVITQIRQGGRSTFFCPKHQV